jgi:hypothetical protein
MRLDAWLKAYEDSPYAQTPKVLAQVAERRSYSAAHGQRAGELKLAEANAARERNESRLRAVGVCLEEIQQRIQTDPTYTARDAASDAEKLRNEYVRLRDALPTLALQVEQARAILADPCTFAENQFAKFPMLADRLPSLPTL